MAVIMILIDSFEDFERGTYVVKHFSITFSLKKKINSHMFGCS